MAHIFISYSKQNKDYARKLADHLKQEGFEIWMDDRIDYGDTWERVIFKAIDECLAFLVIMTPQSYESDWVLRECQYADKRKKPQFPVLLDGEEFPRYVSTQYADVRGGSLLGEDFLRRLEKFVGRRTPPPGPLPVHGEGEKKPQVKAKIDTILDGRLKKLPDQATKATLAPPDVSAILPQPFEWCEIPAGKIAIEYSETDHKTFELPQFCMAKYPITNAQYQVFVDAEDGYRDPSWWEFSDAAKLWRRENRKVQKTAFEGDDLPRTNVTWYEAIAFCQWLTGRIEQSYSGRASSLTQSTLITLPTEQQWQRAAQGVDGRKYPWGNEFDLERCNARERLFRTTTPVTQFPAGASPFGVMDMSGNVWEWCLTEWESDNPDLHVVRGGAYDLNQLGNLVVSRECRKIQSRHSNQGFRVVGVNLI